MFVPEHRTKHNLYNGKGKKLIGRSLLARRMSSVRGLNSELTVMLFTFTLVYCMGLVKRNIVELIVKRGKKLEVSIQTNKLRKIKIVPVPSQSHHPLHTSPSHTLRTVSSVGKEAFHQLTSRKTTS